MLFEGCANSGPDRLGIPEMMGTDGPGFSLCAAPLESLGPGFWVHSRMAKEGAEVWSIPDWRGMEKTLEGKEGQDLAANLVDIRTGSTVHW